jgi:hypothetical protein
VTPGDSACKQLLPTCTAFQVALCLSLGCGGMGSRAADAGAAAGIDVAASPAAVDLCKTMGCCTKVDAGGARDSPLLCLDKYQANFGTVEIGKSSMQIQFVVGNIGPTVAGDILTIVEGTGFEVKSSNCIELGLGETCSVVVRYTPTSTCGEASGTLIVGPAAGGSVTADLQATAVASPAFFLSPAEADFGDVVLGQTITAAFTQYGGICGISDYLFTLSGGNKDFAIDRSRTNCTTTIAAGASCTIVVGFSPTTVGPASSLLVVATDGVTLTAPLMGNGVSP